MVTLTQATREGDAGRLTLACGSDLFGGRTICEMPEPVAAEEPLSNTDNSTPPGWHDVAVSSRPLCGVAKSQTAALTTAACGRSQERAAPMASIAHVDGSGTIVMCPLH